MFIKLKELNLNTSHVKVNQKYKWEQMYLKMHLNTSHVKVNL